MAISKNEFFEEEPPPIKKIINKTFPPTLKSTGIRDLIKAKPLEEHWEKVLQLSEPKETQFTEADENIQTVKKDSFFNSEITEEEMKIIQQRVELQRRKFAEFEKREFNEKSRKILNVFGYLSFEELQTALSDAQNAEEEAIINLAQPGGLQAIRKRIALKYNPPVPEGEKSPIMDKQREAFERLIEKRTKVIKKSVTLEQKSLYKLKHGRLRLDDALAQMNKDPEKAMENWSEARIKAYKLIDTNPNSYFYRFNAPGEKQNNGPWDEDEKALFFKRLEELGANGEWGIFSMAIPGRVGYQCSNLYRRLVENGVIEDPNYFLDEKGKAHYLFNTTKKNLDGSVIKTIRKHNKGSGKSRTVKMKVVKRKKRSRDSDSDEDDDDDDSDYAEGSANHTSWKTTKRTRGITGPSEGVSQSEVPVLEEPSTINPLTGFIDPITLEEVVKPAISKYGHVMGYDTWIRCLHTDGRRNICPMTKKPLTKRDLTILTFDNIEEFRDKIVNW